MGSAAGTTIAGIRGALRADGPATVSPRAITTVSSKTRSRNYARIQAPRNVTSTTTTRRSWTPRRPWTSGWTSSGPRCRSSPRRPPGTRSPSGAGRPPTSRTSSLPPTRARTPSSPASIDFRLARLLGLRASVRRTTLHLAGCSAGAAAPRLAKDFAENSRGARGAHAAALREARAAGAVPDARQPGAVRRRRRRRRRGHRPRGERAEHPLFEIVSAAQTIVPDTEDAILLRITERGLTLSGNSRRSSGTASRAVGIDPPKWNDLFWVDVRAVLQLKPEKLAASRRVLSEYGNMWAATVIIFVLDEMGRGNSGVCSWHSDLDSPLRQWCCAWQAVTLSTVMSFYVVNGD
ncbi:hypothetical protein U9M48_020564 [Paspalum notatum var. saurae]|uniref:chalcone synthase n=1 Tax=Paspalum notatum var. saurae TaxID=547442 RepID=A0AAQ3TFB8_PASNO